MEDDLHRSLRAFGLDKPDDEMRQRAETVIRNYDPCISCATHFLTLDVRR
jgi:coenzyme F420-reducing hydrogenase alpha subunit